MFNLKQLTFLLFLIVGTHSAFSQLGFSHEIGVIAGPVAFQSDFGVRNDFETNAGNTGIGIGIVHYINFSYKADCNCYTTDTYFNDHFKLRSEISWNKTRLDHFGEWANNPKPSYDQLRTHHGEANNFDIGMQLEYFPLSIRSFQGFSYRFAPFFSLGVHYTSYNPKVYSDEPGGNITDPSNFFGPWVNAPGIGGDVQKVISDASGSTWSTVASVGVRYKLNIISDLMLDLRWQYFYSNWVDGLNHTLDSNKANDWLVWLNFGYIYYLD